MHDELKAHIATQTANYHDTHFWSRLPKKARLRRWSRLYDAVYSSLVVFEELDNARRIRIKAYLSQN